MAAGATSPEIEPTSNSAPRPALATGTSGRLGTGLLDVTPRARILPDCTNGPTTTVSTAVTSTTPDRSAVAASAPLLYGTCMSEVPVSFCSSANTWWIDVPCPELAKETASGRVRARPISDGRSFTGELSGTTSTSGVLAIMET